jgi:hypothetical protein
VDVQFQWSLMQKELQLNYTLHLNPFWLLFLCNQNHYLLIGADGRESSADICFLFHAENSPLRYAGGQYRLHGDGGHRYQIEVTHNIPLNHDDCGVLSHDSKLPKMIVIMIWNKFSLSQMQKYNFN